MGTVPFDRTFDCKSEEAVPTIIQMPAPERWNAWPCKRRALPSFPCTMTCASGAVACTSPLFLHDDVHFSQILATAKIRARNPAKCTAACKVLGEVHGEIRALLARGRALPRFPCTKIQSCKKSREVHDSMQQFGRSARLTSKGAVLGGLPFKPRPALKQPLVVK